MMMAQEWKRLPLDRPESVPPLFFSFKHSSKGYDISLTDLIHIWSESLNQKEVLARSLRTETSIDPREDEDQFSVLLEKIEDALSGMKGSTISLSRSTREHGLDLTTTTQLPGPLEPLRWTIHLSILPQNALTKRILLPILRAEANRAARIQSLIDLLKEKDSAISKIFDKIESSGLDLSRTFPGLSGPRVGLRGSALSQVSKVVKGIAPFDENAWNLSFADQRGEGALGLNFAKELDSVHSYRDWDAVESAFLEDWWTRLESVRSSNDGTRTEEKKKAPPVLPTETETESDDEFQRQETPPRLKEARTSTSVYKELSHPPKSTSLEATELNFDSDLENWRKSPSPSSFRHKSKSARKVLETIGTRRKKRSVSKSDEPTASESEAPKPPSKTLNKSKSKGLGTIGGGKAKHISQKSSRLNEEESTASESSDPGEVPKRVATPEESNSDGDLQVSSKRKEPERRVDEDTSQPSKRPPRPRTGGGLGLIGGKKQQEQQEEEGRRHVSGSTEENKKNTRNASHLPQPAPSPKPKCAGKLGMIGGRKSVQKATESQGDISNQQAEETASETDDEATRKVVKETDTEESSQEQQPQRPQTEEKKDETVEERANRKREELRRQLEARGPAKKKRRF
ncbi:hypothetical protein VTO42DRAFT_4546 [Malbranchea cinnamomea]